MKNYNSFFNKSVIFIFALSIYSCVNNRLDTFTKQEIKQFQKLNEISEIEYLRLIASIDVLDSIFIERDTSYKIFKDIMTLEVYKPVITRERKEKLGQDAAENILELLNNYKMSTQLSYKINYSNAAFADTTKSTIGSEATKLIDEIKKASR